MRRKHVVNVIKKEWEVTITNLNATLLVTLMPLLVTVLIFLEMYLVVRFLGEAMANTILQTAVDRLAVALPALADLPAGQAFQVLFFSQFTIFLLIIPTMITIGFATFSIIEEKQSRSLEPLLATPVSTRELLLGKSLAGAVPAVIITWICAGVFLACVALVGSSQVVSLVTTPSWFISVFLLVPLLTLLSFMLGVMASSRFSDIKNAQNIALVIILPVLAIVAVQIVGVVLLTPLVLLIIAVGIGVLNVLALRVGIRLFHRESIVVRWR